MTVKSAVPVRFLVQTAGDLPEDGEWLAEAERAAVARFRIGKRRTDWLLGRWTAKRLLAPYLGLHTGIDTLARIGIVAAADGAPEAGLDGKPLGLSISLSHSSGAAVCAVAPAETALGCDLERIRSLRAATVRDHFTDAERTRVEGRTGDERSLLTTLIWSAKESALKALRQGMRLDTRDVEVEPDVERRAGTWQPVGVLYRKRKRRFAGWWCTVDALVLTIVAEPPAMLPVSITDR